MAYVVKDKVTHETVDIVNVSTEEELLEDYDYSEEFFEIQQTS